MTKNRICKDCGRSPSESRFKLRNDEPVGFQCNSCSIKQWRQRHLEAARQSQRERYAANPVPNRRRACLAARSEVERKKRAEYRKTYPKNRAASKKWSDGNPEKRRAHRRVYLAILAGKLRRLPCEDCGNPKSQAHHEDYSKPLDVKWLCSMHHGEQHRKYK